MKKVSLNLAVLFVGMLLVASCSRNDYFGDEDDFDNLDGQWDDGDWGDEGGASGDDFVKLTTYAIDGNEIIKIQDHSVSQQYQNEQADIGKHQKMWDYYKDLIPLENRKYIKEFVVFHGQGNLAGYVEPLNENDLSRWRMGLAIDITGGLDDRDIKEEFAYTAIHEFAHVLTLNSDQIDVGGSQETCSNYHTGEGCSKSNSYINAFFELGWKDIYEEFLQAEEQGNTYEFYQKYGDRFVTDYAASNPGEDIAEVFTVFVVQDQAPSGTTIADKKIQLMYDFPELVSLRNQIRNDPTLRAMEPGSWVKKDKKRTVFKRRTF